MPQMKDRENKRREELIGKRIDKLHEAHNEEIIRLNGKIVKLESELLKLTKESVTKSGKIEELQTRNKNLQNKILQLEQRLQNYSKIEDKKAKEDNNVILNQFKLEGEAKPFNGQRRSLSDILKDIDQRIILEENSTYITELETKMIELSAFITAIETKLNELRKTWQQTVLNTEDKNTSSDDYFIRNMLF